MAETTGDQAQRLRQRTEGRLKRARRLFDLGAKAAGVGAGGAVALALGDPFSGSAAGVAASEIVEDVGAEIEGRVLAPREHRRMGLAYYHALARMEERIAAGEEPRADYLQLRVGSAPIAGELLEGVTLRARDECDERKVPYMGYLWASLAFSEEVDVADAHHAINLASRLTYRQLVLLALYGNEKDRQGVERIPDWAPDMYFWKDLGIVAEIADLGMLALVARKDRTLIASVADVNPKDLRLYMLGKVLHEFMELARIPESDRTEVRRELVLLNKFRGDRPPPRTLGVEWTRGGMKKYDIRAQELDEQGPD